MSLTPPSHIGDRAHPVVGVALWKRHRPPMTQARKRVELTFEVPTRTLLVLEDGEGVRARSARRRRAGGRLHLARLGPTPRPGRERLPQPRRPAGTRTTRASAPTPDVCLLEPPPATLERGLPPASARGSRATSPEGGARGGERGNPAGTHEVSRAEYAAAGLWRSCGSSTPTASAQRRRRPWALQVWERNKAGRLPARVRRRRIRADGEHFPRVMAGGVGRRRSCAWPRRQGRARASGHRGRGGGRRPRAGRRGAGYQADGGAPGARRGAQAQLLRDVAGGSRSPSHAGQSVEGRARTERAVAVDRCRPSARWRRGGAHVARSRRRCARCAGR